MDKRPVAQDEIKTLVNDIVEENLSDIELSAFITSSYIHGMTDDEVEC